MIVKIFMAELAPTMSDIYYFSISGLLAIRGILVALLIYLFAVISFLAL